MPEKRGRLLPQKGFTPTPSAWDSSCLKHRTTAPGSHLTAGSACSSLDPAWLCWSTLARTDTRFSMAVVVTTDTRSRLAVVVTTDTRPGLAVVVTTDTRPGLAVVARTYRRGPAR